MNIVDVKILKWIYLKQIRFYFGINMKIPEWVKIMCYKIIFGLEFNYKHFE